jgi:nitric oxide reductase NorD protein
LITPEYPPPKVTSQPLRFPLVLIADTAKAVKELDQDGIYTYCINLDPDADDYVQDIFGNQYTVIDNVESLPEKLPQLFMALTK